MFGFAPATAGISPAAYNPINAFNSTREKRKIQIKFPTCDRQIGGVLHAALWNQKSKVSPANYDPALLDKGWKNTTLGFSKGWK